MKIKKISFILYFIFMSLLLLAAGQEKSGPGEEFFSPDCFRNNVRLNLTAKTQKPLFFLNESLATAAGENIVRDSFYCTFFNGESQTPDSPMPAKRVKSKKFGRAVLVNSALWLADSIRYWSMYAGWIEDWQYELSWEDQKKRFFTSEGNRFDSNPFLTNWAHGVSGAVFFSMARYHRLNILESLLFETASSFIWEYVTEWREVISINDNFFSGVGGLPIGECLFRLGNYFLNKPGAGNKVLGYIFNPIIGLNDLLGGKKWRTKFSGPQFSGADIGLYFGLKQVSYKDNEKGPDSLFYIGLETVLNSLPEYGAPGEDNINRFIKEPLISELHFDSSFSTTGIEEYNFYAGVVTFGLFCREIRQDLSKKIKGHSFFLGAGSAFELFRKKGLVYYDKGEYHFDFTAGEQATQPTQFVDKLAIINLIGPVLDLSLYSGLLKFRLSAGAYLDFALVHSMAVNEYSAIYDLYNPRLKTTLAHYGYYYAFGFTLTTGGRISYRDFDIDGKLKYQYYDSIEGLDRFRDRVEDDGNLTDYRLMYKICAGYSIAKSPVKIVFACEGIERKGSLKDITHRESEIRFYSQLKLTF